MRYSTGYLFGTIALLALPLAAHAEEIRFSPADRTRFHTIERNQPASLAFSERVERISDAFEGTPYVANTLIGGPTTPEVLVIRFDGVDCYTFIDLVRAMALSGQQDDFVRKLEQTRYRDGKVAFYNRRHFLTDWWAVSPQNATDVTARLSEKALTVHKTLNRRADGGTYIQGLPPVERNVTYLPPEAVTDAVMAGIRTGDIIGIYTALPGLDVTHTGLAIRKSGIVYFRNASSLKKNMKVVDIPLHDYVQGKPGIMVMRQRD